MKKQLTEKEKLQKKIHRMQLKGCAPTCYFCNKTIFEADNAEYVKTKRALLYFHAECYRKEYGIKG